MGGGQGERERERRGENVTRVTGTALLFTSGGHMPTDTGDHQTQDQGSGTGTSSEVGFSRPGFPLWLSNVAISQGLILTQPHLVPEPPVHQLGLLCMLGHRAGKGALQRCEGQRARGQVLSAGTCCLVILKHSL